MEEAWTSMSESTIIPCHWDGPDLMAEYSGLSWEDALNLLMVQVERELVKERMSST